MIPAGKLQHFVTIERAQRLKTGTAGTVSTVWTAHATARAELVEQVATDEQKPSGTSVRERLTFRLRYLAITPADRLRFRDRQFGIVQVRELGRRQGLEIVCEAQPSP
jgi:head-tail adaptor